VHRQRAYPTAIGSEPDHPGFDTEPLWRTVIIGNGIANGTFMIVANRWGDEGTITFYATNAETGSRCSPSSTLAVRSPTENSSSRPANDPNNTTARTGPRQTLDLTEPFAGGHVSRWRRPRAATGNLLPAYLWLVGLARRK
jgi:hypothetical protein